MTFKLPSRADHVGSFLRPQAVIEARAARAEGTLDAAGLREVEDKAIADLVAWQQGLGLKAITDGEFRRYFFHTDFLLQLAGVEERGGMAKAFKNDAGKDVQFAPPVMLVNGKIAHKAPIQRADYEYLAGAGSCPQRDGQGDDPQPFDAALPRWAVGHSRKRLSADGGFLRRCRLGLSRRKCPRSPMPDAAMCRWTIPISPICAMTNSAQPPRRAGWTRTRPPANMPRLINESFASAPADMIKAIHLCRGNFRSSWAAEGGYEPVAEIMLNELDIDAFFLEYDDPRSGDFAPLRYLPKGKTVVLGLVTTKLGELESKDDVKRRIDEAAKFAPIEQLALSPQCGFASTVHGNDISTQQQADKIRLCVEVAEEVWGS